MSITVKVVENAVKKMEYPQMMVSDKGAIVYLTDPGREQCLDFFMIILVVVS